MDGAALGVVDVALLAYATVHPELGYWPLLRAARGPRLQSEQLKAAVTFLESENTIYALPWSLIMPLLS